MNGGKAERRDRNDLTRGSFSAVADDYLDGRAIKRLMFCYKTIGCAHYRRPEGGCSMCAFPEASTLGTPVPVEALNAQLDRELAGHDWSSGELAELDIFCAGSFFNDEEMPPAARRYCFERAASLPSLRKLLVETRPEYVTAESTAEALDLLGDEILLEVAIGLESADDRIREDIIRKGFGKADFERALSLLAGHERVAVLVYVLLKPPGLSEEQALEDSEATVRYVFEAGRKAGVARITAAIQPSFVQGEGLLHELWLKGEFTPPRLWTVVELVKRVHGLGELQVGTADDSPPPVAVRANCGKCDERVEAALSAYNMSQDIGVFDGVDCECRRQAER